MRMTLRSLIAAKGERRFARPKMNQLRKCGLEPLERRELLTASSLVTGVGTNIEYSGQFGNFLPVGSGPTSYNGFSSFGVVSAPASGFALDSGVSHVNSLSLNLYNTATSGKFAPTAGSFAVYFVPDDTTPISNFRFGGPTGTKSDTRTGLSAIGTTTGDASTLGMDASDLVGTFSITAALPGGYSTFTFNSLGAGAQAGIANDLNNGTDVRLIVVALDNTGKADWEGNFTSGNPQIEVDIDQAPLVNFAAPTYTVNEVDQIPGNHTIATIAVHRSGNPNSPLDIDYHTSDGTAHQPTDYTSANGTLHWNAGDTSDKTFNVSFNDITTLDPSRTVNLSLTDHGGNPITPIIPSGGGAATLSINYKQAGSIAIDQSFYAVNESDGTVAIKIDRTGTNVNSTTADVTLTTANGLAYQNDPQDPQDAQAGRDFGAQGNATAPTYSVHFAVGQTQAIVNVPLLNVKTFAGVRSFTASLSNPSTGTQIITPSSTTVSITDNAVASSETPTGITTQTSGVEINGPFYVNSFLNLSSTLHAGFQHSTMPVLTFGDGSEVFSSNVAVSTVDSLKLSLYNLATSGSFNGTPGSFDVYLLTDNTVDDTALVYGGGTGNTGPSVIGSQASPLYLGTANFTNNQVGYNDFVFDNLPASVKSALAADLNSGGSSAIRFAITPSQGSPVAADWEGNYLLNQPQLTLLTETGTASTAPQVTNVLVDGQNWTSPALGGSYAIPVGSASQTQPLPWTNVNQIQVAFSEDVNVQQSSLVLTGVGGAYAISGFSYNASTFTATWTLSTPIAADKLHIALASTGPAAVTSVAGGISLDGEWTDNVSTYPSGNVTAGGDFNFAFNVLPGDVNQDGVVDIQDLTSVANHWLGAGPTGDVNADGAVDIQDLTALANHWLQTLPAGGGGGGGEADAAVVISDSAPAAPLALMAAATPAVATIDPAATVAAAQPADPVAPTDAVANVPAVVTAQATTIGKAAPTFLAFAEAGLSPSPSQGVGPVLTSVGNVIATTLTPAMNQLKTRLSAELGTVAKELPAWLATLPADKLAAVDAIVADGFHDLTSKIDDALLTVLAGGKRNLGNN